MEHDKYIAARMEEARDYQGISVAELARRTSIERKRLWYILGGQRTMRSDEFLRLCIVLNLDFNYFLPQKAKQEIILIRKNSSDDYSMSFQSISWCP